MRFHLRSLPLAAAVLVGTASARAEQPLLQTSLKVRAGQQVGSTKDHLSVRTIGFGGELLVSLGKNQGIGVELGWSYKPGDQYLMNPAEGPKATGAIIAPSPVSVDSRKHTLSGLAGRVSYQRSFGELGVIGGLQIGGTKFTQEYIGDIRSAAGSTPAFRETYNGVIHKNTLGVSPFVGATYALNANSGFEVNLLALRYTAIDYKHLAGAVASTTTAPSTDVSRDTVATSNRTALHLEVGYVFRF